MQMEKSGIPFTDANSHESFLISPFEEKIRNQVHILWMKKNFLSMKVVLICFMDWQREKQLLCFIYRGYRQSHIAFIYGITVATFKSHRKHLYRKMKFHDRADLFNWCENFLADHMEVVQSGSAIKSLFIFLFNNNLMKWFFVSSDIFTSLSVLKILQSRNKPFGLRFLYFVRSECINFPIHDVAGWYQKHLRKIIRLFFQAPPGAGKHHSSSCINGSTLVDGKKILLLEPRRLAARAVVGDWQNN